MDPRRTYGATHLVLARQGISGTSVCISSGWLAGDCTSTADAGTGPAWRLAAGACPGAARWRACPGSECLAYLAAPGRPPFQYSAGCRVEMVAGRVSPVVPEPQDPKAGHLLPPGALGRVIGCRPGERHLSPVAGRERGD